MLTLIDNPCYHLFYTAKYGFFILEVMFLLFPPVLSLSLVGRDYHLPSAVCHNWLPP